MIGRRKFLSVLGVGAVAAPVAGRQIISAAGGIEGAYAQMPSSPPPNVGQAFRSGGLSFDPWEQARRAFANKETLDKITSELFAEQRTINAIDHDLASKRSFSLAAKVAFQRQRNVERRLADMSGTYPGHRIHEIIQKATKLFG